MGKTCCGNDKNASPSLYVPRVATLKAKRPMTPYDTFFEFELDDGPLSHLYGQFAEVSIPGIGEAPISISSAPSNDRKFQMTIRNAGQVTNALHALSVGEKVGIRGPYGTSFPMKELEGKNLIFVLGGLGLVPARSAILYVLDNLSKYKKVTILFGCKEPAQRVYPEELDAWSKRKDIVFHETVDKAQSGEWNGNVGVITTLFPHLKDVTPADTYAIVVGPPVMYKFAIMGLHDMEFTDDHIIVSLERHMKCGVGKCGHCQINNLYVCQDGPVFTYDTIKHLKEAI
jgi:NAD(P)H-flavin reductase